MRRRHFLKLGAAAGVALRSFGPAAAQTKSSLARIRASGKLRIGVAPAEPWFFKDAASGAWRGIGVDFGQRVATDLGVALATIETSWANCVPALQADQIDIMFVLDPTPERRAAVDFPDAPLFFYAAGALVRLEEQATDWAGFDRPNTRVGVTLSTSMDRKLTETFKTASISRFTTNDEVVAAFVGRKVDLSVLFHPALVVQYARVKVGKVILPNPVVPVATSAGIRQDPNPEFRLWLNDRLEAYYRDGRAQTFFEAYLRDRTIDPASVPGLMKENWA